MQPLKRYSSAKFEIRELSCIRNCPTFPYHNVETGYPITLKFGTQKGGLRANLGTTFGDNTINKLFVTIHEKQHQDFVTPTE